MSTYVFAYLRTMHMQKQVPPQQLFGDPKIGEYSEERMGSYAFTASLQLLASQKLPTIPL